VKDQQTAGAPTRKREATGYCFVGVFGILYAHHHVGFELVSFFALRFIQTLPTNEARCIDAKRA